MKKNICLVLLSFFLTFTFGILVHTGGVMAADGHITISIEKFTLGRGYLLEPTVIPFEEGDTVADALISVLGDGNYQSSGSGSLLYIKSMKDESTAKPNFPQYILNAVEKESKQSELDLVQKGHTKTGWLSEFDYYLASGWMITSNNYFINRSAGAWPLHDGDVIRWQFTVFGTGADLGTSMDSEHSPIIEAANKDALTAAIAQLNAGGQKEEKLKDETFKRYYDNAMFILTCMTSSQEQVDMALANLQGTSTEEPTLPDPDAVPDIGTIAINIVINAIAALPEPEAVTFGNAAAIEDARAAYDALSDDQKELVTNYEKLEALETALAEKRSEAVQAVIGQIDALPAADAITLADAAAIREARAAYEALPEDLRPQVSNLDKLTAAEAVLAELEKPVSQRILTVGAGGKVTPGELEALLGRTVVFFVTPDNGYQVEEVILDGVSLGRATRFTCKKLTEETRIKITFAKAPAPVFNDIANHWGKLDIEYLANLGIVNGKDTNVFAPDELLTRAEFAKILALASGEDVGPYAVSGIFRDVLPGQWFNTYVNWANQRNIVNGVTPDTFAPNVNISRQDMAVMLYRYANVKGIKLSDSAGEARFADDAKIAGYAKDAVYGMKASGIINGKGGNAFASAENATRAEAAAIVHRFLLFSETE